MMTDKDKIIKAIKCRTERNNRCGNPCEETGNCHYAKCMVGLDGEPYYPFVCDTEKLCTDVLALLKEQEAQKFFVDESGKITPLPVIVRCKDCKAWKQYDDMNLGKCELYPEYNKIGDWFCNFGERK